MISLRSMLQIILGALVKFRCIPYLIWPYWALWVGRVEYFVCFYTSLFLLRIELRATGIVSGKCSRLLVLYIDGVTGTFVGLPRQLGWHGVPRGATNLQREFD